ncbi:MAG: hypothetical protein J6Y86_04140 [Pseudobutyrivibrio sp.]|nr:hypothetical protein [Pseudobutyrivibrio sp.]
MTTVGIILSYIIVLVLGGFLGVVIFVDKRNMGDIMVKDDNDQLMEIQFKPGTDISVVQMDYIVLRFKRDKYSSYNGR